MCVPRIHSYASALGELEHQSVMDRWSALSHLPLSCFWPSVSVHSLVFTIIIGHVQWCAWLVTCLHVSEPNKRRTWSLISTAVFAICQRLHSQSFYPHQEHRHSARMQKLKFTGWPLACCIYITGFAILGLLSHFNHKTAKMRKTTPKYQLGPYVVKILPNYYKPTYSIFIHAKKKRVHS